MQNLSIFLPLLSVFVLILVSGFFSGSETGLTSISRAKIHKLKMEGNRRAGIVSKLHENKEQLISAILLGNNVVNIAASAIATALAIRLFGPTGVIYATIVMTILVLIFAEVLPKTYAVRHAEQVALAVAPILSRITTTLAPFTMGIQVIVNRTIAIISSAPKDDMTGVEVLRGTVEMYHHDGDVLTDDKDMLSGIFNLGDIEVDQIMIHRSDMVSISIHEDPAEICRFVAESLHSRIPVWEGAPDRIMGILHAKDLFKALQSQKDASIELDIKSLLRDPWFVPETITLKNQLKAFQEHKKHIAMVVDEFGSVTGLITLEDIIEEVVGEIDDEYDEPTRERITHCKDGSYNVAGDLTIRDFNRDLELNLSDTDATTIAGYLIAEAQRIPDAEEIFEISDIMFKVLEREANQITKIKIRKVVEDELPASEVSENT
ncbi:MAG: Mg2+/Co2+ transporter CorB [Candidatus Pelagisphaera sp.]|jgi:Mg2+/Co2+ transporter CorB